MDTLSERLDKAVKSFSGASKITDCDYFIFSQDGIVVYSNMDETKYAQELGALSGGLCQAALQLAKLYQFQDPEKYRLDFSTSNMGLFILPIAIKDITYFVANFYKNAANPGVNKILFRSLVNYLVEIEGLFEMKRENNFLFKNIKDEEIDQLFKEANN